MTYAKGTEVSVERSLIEIRSTLTRYGATGFALFDQPSRIDVGFEMRKHRVRFRVILPPRAEFQKNSRGGYRTDSAIDNAYQQAIRERWRGLLLVIKAKLEAVDAGIETFDEAFAAQLLLPNGKTVSEHILPLIEESRHTGKMPPLLMLGDGT